MACPLLRHYSGVEAVWLGQCLGLLSHPPGSTLFTTDLYWHSINKRNKLWFRCSGLYMWHLLHVCLSWERDFSSVAHPQVSSFYLFLGKKKKQKKKQKKCLFSIWQVFPHSNRGPNNRRCRPLYRLLSPLRQCDWDFGLEYLQGCAVKNSMTCKTHVWPPETSLLPSFLWFHSFYWLLWC